MTKEKSSVLNLIMYGASSPSNYHYSPSLSENVDYRVLVEELNNFHHEILPQISYPIEPIPDWDVPYGEREPYQVVKAHLISQNSNRISSSSKNVDDYKIENKGALSINPQSLDKVKKDLKEQLVSLTREERNEVLTEVLNRINSSLVQINNEFYRDYWTCGKWTNPPYYYKNAILTTLSPLSKNEIDLIMSIPIKP